MVWMKNIIYLFQVIYKVFSLPFLVKLSSRGKKQFYSRWKAMQKKNYFISFVENWFEGVVTWKFKKNHWKEKYLTHLKNVL